MNSNRLETKQQSSPVKQKTVSSATPNSLPRIDLPGPPFLGFGDRAPPLSGSPTKVQSFVDHSTPVKNNFHKQPQSQLSWSKSLTTPRTRRRQSDNKGHDEIDSKERELLLGKSPNQAEKHLPGPQISKSPNPRNLGRTTEKTFSTSPRYPASKSAFVDDLYRLLQKWTEKDTSRQDSSKLAKTFTLACQSRRNPSIEHTDRVDKGILQAGATSPKENVSSAEFPKRPYREAQGFNDLIQGSSNVAKHNDTDLPEPENDVNGCNSALTSYAGDLNAIRQNRQRLLPRNNSSSIPVLPNFNVAHKSIYEQQLQEYSDALDITNIAPPYEPSDQAFLRPRLPPPLRPVLRDSLRRTMSSSTPRPSSKDLSERIHFPYRAPSTSNFSFVAERAAEISEAWDQEHSLYLEEQNEVDSTNSTSPFFQQPLQRAEHWPKDQSVRDTPWVQPIQRTPQQQRSQISNEQMSFPEGEITGDTGEFCNHDTIGFPYSAGNRLQRPQSRNIEAVDLPAGFWTPNKLY